MGLIELRQAFNLELIKTMSGSILSNSIFGWGGYGSTIFGVCFIIALFQSFTKDEKSMLTEWTKIVITSWFCLSILGHPAANYSKVFPFLGGGGGTLDIAVFNYAKSTFDAIGKEMSQKEGGAESLEKYNLLLNETLEKFLLAVTACDAGNVECIRGNLQGAADAIDKPPDEPSNAFSAIAAYLEKMFTFFKRLAVNPLILLFPILMALMQMVRGVIEMFMLVTFGLITALTLLMSKIVCPLMVLPAYRGRVIGIFKTTLSTSLYGFVSHFILWISIILTKALYKTTGEFFISQIGNMSASSLGSIYFLVVTNFFTSFVILVMQAAAIAKIPKFCRQFMNLSLEEIVNIGETLLQAGVGMAKVVGALGVGALTGGAALAAGGLSSAGALSGAAGGKFGGMLNSVGKGANMLNSGAQRMGFDGFIPKGGGGAKNPASQLLSGGGGSGGGDAGRDMALGGANAGSKTDVGSFLKKGDKPKAGTKADGSGGGGADDELQALEEKQKSKGFLSPDEAREKMRLENAKEADVKPPVFGGGKGVKGLLSAVGGIAEDGAMAGMGSGDGTTTMRGLAAAASTPEARQKAFAMGEKLTSRTMSKAEVAATSEASLNRLGSGPEKMDEEQTANFTALQQHIVSGEASDTDRTKFMQMANKYQMNDDQKDSYETLVKQDVNLSKIVQKEEKTNAKLMESISKGNPSQKQLVELNQRLESGMMSTVGAGSNQPLRKSLEQTTSKNYKEALTSMEEKFDKTGQLGDQDRQQLSLISNNTSRAVMGDNSSIDKINKISGGMVDVNHLRMGVEESAKMAGQFSSSMSNAQKQAEVGAAPKYAKLSDKLEVAFDASGEIEGIMVDGQVITSAEEFNKLSDRGQGYQDLKSYMQANDNYNNNFEVRDAIKNPRAKQAMNAGTQGQFNQFLQKLKG